MNISTKRNLRKPLITLTLTSVKTTRTDTAIGGSEGKMSEIRGVPAADVAPVVHGRWVEYPRAHYFKCSECRYTVPYRKAVSINGRREYSYCPNCGARMDGEANGSD